MWLAGGSAVHEVTEAWDRASVADELQFWRGVEPVWTVAFDAQLAEAFEREPDYYKWGSAKTEPPEVWRQMGLEFVQNYIAWRERSPWEIWTTPDGQPAIELEVSGYLPGCPVEIKAFVDRVFVDPVFGGLWDVDLKSGKKPPTSASQFETYTALMEVKYGVRVTNGIHFLNRRGTVGKPFDLSEVTPEAIGKVYGEAWEQIQGYAKAGKFPAKGYPNECWPLCDVAASCAAQNGPLAHLYDPESPGHPSNTPPY
jgi:putative RecB family exonuclease